MLNKMEIYIVKKLSNLIANWKTKLEKSINKKSPNLKK